MNHVLEIGTGSGYQTSILSMLFLKKLLQLRELTLFMNYQKEIK